MCVYACVYEEVCMCAFACMYVGMFVSMYLLNMYLCTCVSMHASIDRFCRACKPQVFLLEMCRRGLSQNVSFGVGIILFASNRALKIGPGGIGYTVK